MIVVFGSINCDFIFDMPVMPVVGQTLLASGLRIEPGGKGANQGLAAARDGARVAMVGAVGADVIADTALSGLDSHAIDLSRVVRVEQQTGCTSIFIDDQGHNLIAVAPGANMEARASQVDDMLLAEASTFLFQMETDPRQMAELARRVKMAGKRSILNLAPAIPVEPAILSLFDLVVVNEDEAQALGGWLGCTPDCESLSRRLGTGVLCTLGGNGSQAFADGRHAFAPAISVDIIDTSAAGDCYIGVLAASLDRGLTLEDAMKRASCAAGLACAQRGSQKSIPYAEETTARLAQTI
ncbi:ribokinase [Pelagibacterium sediminicola]|uniref:ribokinase n=1 Tax=Pelagibacterium sediminicola TaxID=2248761 RepID=UPI000E31B2AC|nr:ribokinase [Pelagibacterium sediminicola]